ncbi:MAG: hypothetical protein BSOLF_2644 [Candidatus Carbobacillus altaicus]|uniref:Uncharacterized protein n=1 Tax=Candidatus Carbonibacillus altaicus TaxID=2163959 RepID=A0A2R6Y2I5_9BACL|nr:MAG: hypothetical protein BSOLF_2644 [Candidatus Carbobacillus altaicus]
MKKMPPYRLSSKPETDRGRSPLPDHTDEPGEDQAKGHDPEKVEQLLTELETLLASTRPLARLAKMMEQGECYDLLYNYTRPFRIIYTNFLAGVVRGFGITIGATVIVALLVLVLRQFVSLPLIGEYIAKILDLVDVYRSVPLR